MKPKLTLILMIQRKTTSRALQWFTAKLLSLIDILRYVVFVIVSTTLLVQFMIINKIRVPSTVIYDFYAVHDTIYSHK